MYVRVCAVACAARLLLLLIFACPGPAAAAVRVLLPLAGGQGPVIRTYSVCYTCRNGSNKWHCLYRHNKHVKGPA